MATKKVQVVALVDPDIKTGLDMLRMISQESRARVLEDVIAPAVWVALTDERPAVERIEALAKRAGMSVPEYVAAYAEAYKRESYGPGLDALYKDDRAVTGKKTKPPAIKAA